MANTICRLALTIFAYCCVGLPIQPSFAAGPKDLFVQGKEAYDKGDFVDALKYSFAYKVMLGNALDADPIEKKQLEEIISYCEKTLRDSVRYTAIDAAKKRKYDGVIGVKGVLQETNPYLKADRSVLEKAIMAGPGKK